MTDPTAKTIEYRGRRFTATEFEREFNPRIAAFDAVASSATRERLSAQTRGRLASTLGIAYGERERETFDFFPAKGRLKAPVLVYIHGGYWRSGKSLDNSFIAESFVNAGIAAVILNYDLCPAVTIGDIVAQVRRAMPAIQAKLPGLGADATRLVLSGHSAGAHLVGMVLAHDWRATPAVPAAICGAVMLSGIYDVEPALNISVNAEIRATPADVAPYSPLRLPIVVPVPMVVAVGASEPYSWREQSWLYAAHARTHGCVVQVLEVPGDDHFGVVFRMHDAVDALTRAALALFR